ncbi:MAG: hypothetical protein ABIB46_06315 [bacterium]
MKNDNISKKLKKSISLSEKTIKEIDLEKMNFVRDMLNNQIEKNRSLISGFYDLSKLFKFKQDSEKCKIIARKISDVSDSMKVLMYRLQSNKNKDLLK